MVKYYGVNSMYCMQCMQEHLMTIKIMKLQKTDTRIVVTIPHEMYSVIEGAEYVKCSTRDDGTIVLTPVVD